MVKIGKIVFKYIVLLALFFNPNINKSQVFKTESIFEPPKALYKKPIHIQYNFKEFNDIELYNNSIKNIHWFSQYKRAPFSIKNTTYYNPSLDFYRIDSFLKQKKISLNALHYYIDLKSIKKYEGYTQVNTRLPYEYIYQPFLIGNGEVTNAEYREFLFYVRDSIARTLITHSASNQASKYGIIDDATGGRVLKWDKKVPYDSNVEELKIALAPMYLPESERFYSRQEIDSRKMNYEFWLIENHEKNIINIVPDTLAWVHDLTLNGETSCSLESYCNMYFWHPYYDNYPVVGLTYNQVHAFLFWKTKKLQNDIESKGLNMIVEYDLPNEIELEMINLIKVLKSNSLNYKKRIFKSEDVSKNYDFDLYLNVHSITHYEFDKQLNLSNRAGFLTNEFCIKNRKSNRFIYPSIGPINSKNLNSISLAYFNSFVYYGGLPFLNGNVSEWMHENFSNDDSTMYVSNEGKLIKSANNLFNRSITFPFNGNFEDSYSLYKYLNDSVNDFVKLKYKLIDSTKVKNDLCKLVRGANWFDSGDFLTGHLKKTFSPKDSAYSTLGFRYVVRFKKK